MTSRDKNGNFDGSEKRSRRKDSDDGKRKILTELFQVVDNFNKNLKKSLNINSFIKSH